MDLKIAAAALAMTALTGCGLTEKPDTGFLILKCTGSWTGTDTPAQPATMTYRINFDAKTIEFKHVKLGTWHRPEMGERVFFADKKMISLDGQDAQVPGMTLTSSYTLQFDRETGRVVDGQLMIASNPPETVEHQFEGMCQPEKQGPVEPKF